MLSPIASFLSLLSEHDTPDLAATWAIHWSFPADSGSVFSDIGNLWLSRGPGGPEKEAICENYDFKSLQRFMHQFLICCAITKSVYHFDRFRLYGFSLPYWFTAETRKTYSFPWISLAATCLQD